MGLKVRVPSSNTIKVRIGNENTLKVVASNLTDLTTVNSLSALTDVDLTGIQDNFVLQYNSSTGKFIGVDPDQILSDAAVGGIPGDFINVLDTDPNRVDNIDFDGGAF